MVLGTQKRISKEDLGRDLMVEFLLTQFQDLPMFFYRSDAPWYLVVSPLDISQAISPPLAQRMINAPDPIVENGRSGGPPQLN